MSLAPEEIADLVVRVITARESVPEAARRAQVSTRSVETWRQLFLDGGLQALEGAGPRRPPTRESLLEKEVESLKEALGEVFLELDVWRDLHQARHPQHSRRIR
ncbi:helix-turn-helix domain-containing protein [Streptomyces sp. NBC_00287]|uniref:helix-turn-helix domain-containing protein n=1 Tax=Streptomyces sp. NBC_00287 TaxID=2975702 RepID=UPI002E28DEDE|nr:helix-turn-helix domain-containing protein [Streptomyces sp. NBC_00287]